MWKDDLKKSNYYNYGIPSKEDKAEMQHFAEQYESDLREMTEGFISELQKVLEGKVTSKKLRKVFRRFDLEFNDYGMR